MGEFELSPSAQACFNLVLIWIGFGTVAGLLAKALFPAREPSGAVAIITLGIVGSVVGPLTLSFVLRGPMSNPISPLGLLAASGAALALMVLYRFALHSRLPEQADEEPVDADAETD